MSLGISKCTPPTTNRTTPATRWTPMFRQTATAAMKVVHWLPLMPVLAPLRPPRLRHPHPPPYPLPPNPPRTTTTNLVPRPRSRRKTGPAMNASPDHGLVRWPRDAGVWPAEVAAVEVALAVGRCLGREVAVAPGCPDGPAVEVAAAAVPAATVGRGREVAAQPHVAPGPGLVRAANPDPGRGRVHGPAQGRCPGHGPAADHAVAPAREV